MLIYKKLAKVTVARLKSLENPSGNYIKYTKEIEEIMSNYFPSSFGVKCDFDFEKSTGEKLVINGIYHSNGRWINFSVILNVDVDDEMGFAIKIKGNFAKYQFLEKSLFDWFFTSFIAKYIEVE